VIDRRITGSVTYSQDVELDGMLHARILRSPYPHARIRSVGASGVPGSCVVLTPADVRGYGRYGPQIQDATVLAVDRALYAGDPVAALAAPTRREAAEALAAIEVDYEELPAVYDPVEAAEPGAVLVHETAAVSENDAAYFDMRPQPGTNVCHRFRIRHGEDPGAVRQRTRQRVHADQRPQEQAAGGQEVQVHGGVRDRVAQRQREEG